MNYIIFMALNLFNNTGNTSQMTSTGKSWLDRTSKQLGTPSNFVKTIKGKPTTITKGYSFKKKVTLPEKQTLSYDQAGIPTEESNMQVFMPLKSAISIPKPKQRQDYVKSVSEYNTKVNDYNNQIKSEKSKVDIYNQQVNQWNTKDRFQTVTQTQYVTETYTPTTTITFGKSTSPVTSQSFNLLNKSNNNSDIGKTSPMTSSGQNWLNSTSKIFEEKPKTFTQEVSSQFIQKPYVTTSIDIFKGSLITFKNPKEAGVILKEESLPRLQAGATKVFNAFRLKGVKENPLTQEKAKQISNQYIVPGLNKTYNAFSMKSFPQNEPQAKQSLDLAKSRLSNPQYQASAVILGGELAVSYGLTKVPQAVEYVRYKGSGTYIEPKTFYSETAIESPNGLDLTFNPTKIKSSFKSTFNKTPELPNQFVVVHQAPSKMIGTQVLTREQLLKKGLTQGSEMGEFVSPKGTGQTGFLGIGQGSSEYEFTLNPFKRSRPTTYQYGVQGIIEYPKEILNTKSISKSDLIMEQFQRTQAPKSNVIISKMSSLGKKAEPDVILPVTSNKIKVKTPLQYTEVNGRIVPIETYTIPTTKQASLIPKSKFINKNQESIIFKRSKEYQDLVSGTPKKYVSINPSYLLKSNYNSSSVSKLYPNKLSSGTYPSKPRSEPSPSIPKVVPDISSFNYLYGSSKTTSTRSSTEYPKDRSYNYNRSNYSSPTYNFKFLTPTDLIAKKRKRRNQFSILSQYNNEQAYIPEVLKNGKWKALTGQTYDLAGAINKGSNIVDKTYLRSFRIKQSGTNPTIKSRNISNVINKFYNPSKTRSSRLSGAYIEKPKFANDLEKKFKGFKI